VLPWTNRNGHNVYVYADYRRLGISPPIIHPQIERELLVDEDV
jgi:hypothetical protein